jgi:hypothetical protein
MARYGLTSSARTGREAHFFAIYAALTLTLSRAAVEGTKPHHVLGKRTKNVFNSTPAVKAAKIAGCLSHAYAPSLRGFAVFHAETTLDLFRRT